MGRHEKAVDPAAGPVQLFAYELRKLRAEAGGPTYRALAQRSSYSAPTLSAAAAGVRLPSLPVALAYAVACGGDTTRWERRWREAAAEAVTAHVGDPAPVAPYPGLGRFGPGDREHFFGRDELVAELVELTRRSRLCVVVGASGSGKSSLLRAGLIPAMQEKTTPGPRPAAIRLLTPGEQPAGTHGQRFVPAEGEGAGDGDTVVVVDQFEETFTLCHDPSERTAFINLLATARTPDSRLRVIVAVRADFYGQCAEHPALASALRDACLLVGPMSPAQLREAIVGPATAAKLIVERALTARIVADVADEPGGLPLMSHALLETWRRRRGRTLTEASYDAIGGVRGAIAHTAEEVYTGFSPDQARTARALLLRLISPGDGTQDTRRPAARDELGTTPTADRVLERLVRARLLTTDDGTVNLAHEALITAWPRLRGWIATDRERLRLHRRLTGAARMWEELDRDEGALFRGTQLGSVREAFADKNEGGYGYGDGDGDGDAGSGSGELTSLEANFLAASLAANDRAQNAATRTAHRLRTLLATLAVLLCLAVVAGLIAWQQSRTSARQAAEAEARRVAAVAGTLRRSDPRTAMRLSVAAWRIADLPETRDGLFEAAAQRDLDIFSAGSPEFAPDNNDTRRGLSQDGRTLTVVGPDRTERWDVSTGRPLPTLKGLGRYATKSVALSPDTRSVAVLTPRGIRIWDLATGRLTGPAFGPSDYPVEGDFQGGFTSNGRTFATQSRDHTVQLWDLRDGRLLSEVPYTGSEPNHLVVSADDGLLAFCPDTGPLQVWDARERRRVPTPWATKADVCGQRFQFTPDGRALAVSTGNALRTWDVRSGRERFRITASGLDEAVFSEDGTHVATLASEEIRLWRTADPSIPVFRHPLTGSSLGGLTLDLKGGVIRYVEGDNLASATHTVALDGAAPRSWQKQPFAQARFSPDGSVLATSLRRGTTMDVQLRDGRTGRQQAIFPSATDITRSKPVPMTAFSPDSRTFAHLSAPDTVTVRPLGLRRTIESPLPPRAEIGGIVLGDGSVTVSNGRSFGIESLRLGERSWSALPRKRYGTLLARAPDGRLITDEGRQIDPKTGRATRVMRGEASSMTVAFSPDGRYLAAADMDGRVTLWDGEGKNRLALLMPGVVVGVRGDWAVPALAFSPDSRTLAVGDADGDLRLWDTASPRSKGAPLPPADGPVLALAFGEGGSELRVTTPHTVLRTYPLAPDRTAETVCARSGGALSRGAWETYLPTVPYRRTC
ncbi:hypothetical protein ABCR94_02405 [Streptomyces sp. 21So2-11]|uniref:nSTAND1 domain-containing NTPase n=1 Tax=Streptomyces sp. 21So2-11 TaxID=3144408 RepID=UPI00321AC7F7